MNQNTFGIIQSLCRIGLAKSDPAFRKQVERLKKQLIKENDAANSETLESLLQAAEKPSSFQPSKFTISPSFAGREQLSQKTSPPSDRETGAALAEIIFPNELNLHSPILDQGLQSATESIVEEWNNHEKLREANILPPSTLLIYGLPGTGKTCLALSIAAKLNLPVVLARLDGLISSFLGTTGRNIGNLFAFANRYSCVLLLDEFDAIAKVRDDPHEVGEIKRVVNAILQNIDQRRDCGMTIAITNHESLLDSAVWRRFDLRLAVPPPSFEVRINIAKRYIPDEFKDEDTLRFIAWLSKGMTGSDIEVMSRTLKRHLVLNPGAPLIDSLNHYSLTQSGRDSSHHQRALSLSKNELARELLSDEQLNFTQKRVSNLLGISQSTISRSIEHK